MHILAKVRLADLVEVKKGLSNSQYFKAFAKIKAKHVDFVLARPANLAVLCAIEVDDGSHVRCTDINGVEDQICEKLKIHKK